MTEKVYSFTHGTVMSWPDREQPVVVVFYADFKHGPYGEKLTPYMSQNLNLTLEAARSLVEKMSEAIAHAERATQAAQPMECIAKTCATPEVCANPNVRCALV